MKYKNINKIFQI